MNKIKVKLSEESLYGIYILASLVGILLVMVLLNFFMGGDKKEAAVEETKEKTIIVTEVKKSDEPQKPLSQSAANTVRDAIKKGNYSTARLEINKVSKSSPEYEELNKVIAEENSKRKSPGIRKEKDATPAAPLRYLAETTPRTRDTDAVYVYFMDIYGKLWPRFCIQNASSQPVGISGFSIKADNRTFDIKASAVKFSNTEKGVAEWYDEPLDQNTYGAVQAMIKAKKVTLTTTSRSGSTTRDITDAEKKGMLQILEGYAALGGDLSYLKESTPAAAPPAKKRP